MDLMDKDIVGSGGGGKGGGSPAPARIPREDPNTLRSNATVRILDLLGEGEIAGLVDGLRSVYLDETPVMNANGTLNFEGIALHTRNGEPVQSPIPGFSSVESEIEVGSEVRTDTSITRTVSNPDVDAVRIKIRVPALTFQNIENGDLKGTSVQLAIDVQASGGSFQQRATVDINGKTTSPYERSVRVNLPGSAPWQIRVRRITADSNEANLRNETYFTSYTEIIDSKLTYPDSALIGLEVDARQFGSSVPSRAYHVRGTFIKVPSNYDPATRAYSGFWNGQFKLAYSNNPAWIYYDLATNTRYGANVDADKWLLYEIGRYCDELVPDGYGGMEPRFTVNTVITDSKDANIALNTLASAFRGMTYWGTNSVVAVADAPADPVKIVTPANVIDGVFQYSGSALKARHSVALVSWNDPEDNYRQQIEVVEDSDSVQRFGWRTTEVTAFGCTSRGMANRLGRWILYTERSETEIVSYTAGVDHADLRPGDIIAVSDPTTAGARLGGRILDPELNRLVLDKVPEEASGHNWFIDVVLPNGAIERRQIDTFSDDTVNLKSPLSQMPVKGAVYILSSQDINPRLFRVLSVTENDGTKYGVTAVEHNPNKYAEVELGIFLPEPEVSLIPRGPIVPPMDITIETYTYVAGGTNHQAITVSWTASDDPRVNAYILEAQGPSDSFYQPISNDQRTSVDILDAEPGQWSVRVRSVSPTGLSPWVIRTSNVNGLLLPSPPTTVDIRVGVFSVTLSPKGLTAGAVWEFWRSNAPLSNSEIESNAVNLGGATVLADTELNHSTTYYYYIRGVNVYGVSDWYPVQATTESTPSAILSALEGQITETALHADLTTRINSIEQTADNAATAESVTQLIENEIDTIASQVNTVSTTVDGHTTTLQTQAQSIDGLSASYSVRIDNNGRVAGYGLASGEGGTSDFIVLTDRFSIFDAANPTQMVLGTQDGQTFIRGAYIDKVVASQIDVDDLSAISADLGTIKVGVANIEDRIQSTNYSATQGWRLDKNGQLTANNANIRGHINATSGTFSGTLSAGTVFTNNLIATNALQANAVSNIASVYSGGEQSTGFSWITLAHVNIPAAIRNVVSSGRTVVCQFSFEGKCSRDSNNNAIALMEYQVQRRNTSGNYSTVLEGRFREFDFTVITGVAQLASNTNRMRIVIRKITGPGSVFGRRILINVMSLKR